MPFPKSIIEAIRIVSVLMLASCQATSVRGAEYLNVPSNSKSFFVNARSGSPVITIGQSNPNKFLAIFISPTCNFCEHLYLSIVEAIQEGDKDFDRVETTFALTPRKEADYEIIQGFMCIDTKNFPLAVTRYYLEIYGDLNEDVIPEDYALKKAREIVKRFGVSDSDYERCVNSKEYRETVSKVFVLADKLRTKNEVPFVIFNDRPTEAQLYFQVKTLLRDGGTR